MKLLIDTSWADFAADLLPEQQMELFWAIMDYPNRQCNLNCWKKIEPLLEKGRISYINRLNNLQQGGNNNPTGKRVNNSPDIVPNGVPTRDSIGSRMGSRVEDKEKDIDIEDNKGGMGEKEETVFVNDKNFTFGNKRKQFVKDFGEVLVQKFEYNLKQTAEQPTLTDWANIRTWMQTALENEKKAQGVDIKLYDNIDEIPFNAWSCLIKYFEMNRRKDGKPLPHYKNFDAEVKKAFKVYQGSFNYCKSAIVEAINRGWQGLSDGAKPYFDKEMENLAIYQAQDKKQGEIK